MSPQKPFLVTGAPGYLGGVLVQQLSRQGIPVRALVRSEAKAATVRDMGATETIIGDLLDPASLARAVDGVQGIYHVASIFREAGLPDSAYFETNANGTRNLFTAAIAAGVPRLIHCSTIGVLGHIANPPGTEETPYGPGDYYQRSKLAGEKIAMEFFRQGQIGGCVIRPAMIYGPGDTRNLKMFRMIAACRFFYVGPGVHVHFVDVRDVARAFQLAMEHAERNGQVYIIAGEKSVALQEAAELIAKLLGVPPPWLRLPAKPLQWAGSTCEWICKPFKISPPIYRRRIDFFMKNRSFSCAKAERELGFRPTQSFENEMAEAVDWYRKAGWLGASAHHRMRNLTSFVLLPIFV
ncbi:MAG: NAD-dependent epimerase/dehydratase family protein [Verrucomicrobia bacterium]|nr:NAD-dependent epimerase/dehydratase family protein [Verrucomicrobiota bacterium]